VAVELLELDLEALEQRVARRLAGGVVSEGERGQVAVLLAPQRRDLTEAPLDARALGLAVALDQRADGGVDDRAVDRGLGGPLDRRRGRRLGTGGQHRHRDRDQRAVEEGRRTTGR
jgi:hypothetical protein